MANRIRHFMRRRKYSYTSSKLVTVSVKLFFRTEKIRRRLFLSTMRRSLMSHYRRKFNTTELLLFLQLITSTDFWHNLIHRNLEWKRSNRIQTMRKCHVSSISTFVRPPLPPSGHKWKILGPNYTLIMVRGKIIVKYVSVLVGNYVSLCA